MPYIRMQPGLYKDNLAYIGTARIIQALWHNLDYIGLSDLCRDTLACIGTIADPGLNIGISWII